MSNETAPHSEPAESEVNGDVAPQRLGGDIFIDQYTMDGAHHWRTAPNVELRPDSPLRRVAPGAEIKVRETKRSPFGILRDKDYEITLINKNGQLYEVKRERVPLEYQQVSRF